MSDKTDKSGANSGHVRKMSATERLRALLDERRVKWEAPKSAMSDMRTLYSVDDWDVQVDESGNGWFEIDMTRYADTPEQAAAATLGPGTCHPIISDNLTESEGTGDAWADCSECGHLLFVLTDPNSEPPNYCPNCGRRVVG